MALVRVVMTTHEGDAAFAARAEHIRAEHEARARAELAAADRCAPGSDVVPLSGALIAEVALVKGLPGPAEASGGGAVTGADGEAADRALDALGWSTGAVFRTVSRPEPSIEPAARAARLRGQLEAVDAGTIIALDRVAADDLAEAFDIEPLAFGIVVQAGGRRLVAVDGLEEALGDEGRKRRVWQQFRAAAPEGPVY